MARRSQIPLLVCVVTALWCLDGILGRSFATFVGARQQQLARARKQALCSIETGESNLGGGATATLQPPPARSLSEQAKEIRTERVVDIETLVAKYGGPRRLVQIFQKAVEAGYYKQAWMPAVREFFIDYAETHLKTGANCYVKLKFEGGGELKLIGVSHFSWVSHNLVRQSLEEMQPDCLVLERRLGDDSIQRLTIPDLLIQNLTMPVPPAKLMTDDDDVELYFKFEQDRVWMETTPAWYDVGGECAASNEFGVAFEAFAKQIREAKKTGRQISKNRRGPTICFADADIRRLNITEFGDLKMKPSIHELGNRAVMPLRDMQMAQAMRFTMKTHDRVIGIVGRDHVAGILNLLERDPRITVVEKGFPVKTPKWEKDWKVEEGKPWLPEGENDASMFARLSASSDENPTGTFFDEQAILQLMEMREETATRIKREGLEKAKPAAGRSSELCRDFYSKGWAATPLNEKELRNWLSGEILPPPKGLDEAFAFENNGRPPTYPSLAWMMPKRK